MEERTDYKPIYDFIKTFVKTRAEKYSAIEVRNKCVSNKVNYGDPYLNEYSIKDMEANINNCNKKSLNQESQTYEFVNSLKLENLILFSKLVKIYSKKREDEIDRLKEEFNENSGTLKGFIVGTRISYYEKYERIAIKDLLYIICRRKAIVMGFSNDEAHERACKELDELINSDILTDEIQRGRKKD